MMGKITSEFVSADLGCCKFIANCWFQLILAAKNIRGPRWCEKFPGRKWLVVGSVSSSMNPLLFLWPVETLRATTQWLRFCCSYRKILEGHSTSGLSWAGSLFSIRENLQAAPSLEALERRS
jgi:hypothetical protein